MNSLPIEAAIVFADIVVIRRVRQRNINKFRKRCLEDKSTLPQWRRIARFRDVQRTVRGVFFSNKIFKKFPEFSVAFLCALFRSHIECVAQSVLRIFFFAEQVLFTMSFYSTRLWSMFHILINSMISPWSSSSESFLTRLPPSSLFYRSVKQCVLSGQRSVWDASSVREERWELVPSKREVSLSAVGSVSWRATVRMCDLQ